MHIQLVHTRAEGNDASPEFLDLLDKLGSLYANNVAFKYDPTQSAVVVSKSGRVLGTVRAEGALHTIIWAALSIAEKEA